VSGGWKNSGDRKDSLPDDWEKRRLDVLARDDFRCVWKLPSGARCSNPATDVDHIGSRWNHSLRNLRSLCGPHHDKRTALQGNAAKPTLPPRKPPEVKPSDGWR
jgi:5-methylcytosine-specific restriction protein A